MLDKTVLDRQNEIGLNFVTELTVQESGLIRLRWDVATNGYSLVERPLRRGTSGSESPAGTFIVPRDGPRRTYDIALREHDVFLQLANSQSLQDVLDFSNRWGQLHCQYATRSPKLDPDKWHRMWKDVWPDYHETDLGVFRYVQKVFARALAVSSKNTNQLKQNFKERDYGQLSLEWSRQNLVLRPSSLKSFCLLELHQALQGGANVSRCLECSVYLPMKFRKGRPADYCSSACKQRHWRRNQTDK